MGTQIQCAKDGDFKIITLSGFLDASEVGRFSESLTLATAEEELILLDCSALEYLDSSGLAAFVKLNKNLSARNARLAIFGFSESILRVLHFTKLDRIFNLAGGLEEAKTKIQP